MASSSADSAQALFENNVIVQARDAFGNLLTQVVTTGDQNGNWSATLRFLTANGDRGSIYAFSTSPVDGSITTDDLVRVTFASNCQVRTDWPVYIVQPGDTLFAIAQRTGSTVGELTVANCLANPNRIERGQRLFVPRLPDSGIEIVTPEMTIIAPVADAELALDAPITVDGSALGVLTGNVFVRALDADGRVLDSVRGSVVVEPDADGVWSWQAELRPRDVTTGTHGMLFAYSVSPLDGRIETSALVPVIYGPEHSHGDCLVQDQPAQKHGHHHIQVGAAADNRCWPVVEEIHIGGERDDRAEDGEIEDGRHSLQSIRASAIRRGPNRPPPARCLRPTSVVRH